MLSLLKMENIPLCAACAFKRVIKRLLTEYLDYSYTRRRQNNVRDMKQFDEIDQNTILTVYKSKRFMRGFQLDR